VPLHRDKRAYAIPRALAEENAGILDRQRARALEFADFDRAAPNDNNETGSRQQ
jgi:hypothetical protein